MTLFEKSRELLTIYHDSWDHGAKILAIKKPFELDPADYLPGYPNLPRFKGVIDWVVKVLESVVVLGFETSWSRLNALQLDNDARLTGCSLEAPNLGFQPNKFWLDVLVTGPKPELVSYEWSQESLISSGSSRRCHGIGGQSALLSFIPGLTGTAITADGRGIVWLGDEKIEEDRNEPGW